MEAAPLKRRTVLAACLLAATLAVTNSAPAGSATLLVPQTPYSVFALLNTSPMDGIADWVIVNQAPDIGGPEAAYFYGFAFQFTNGTKVGWLGLIHFQAGRSVFGLFGDGPTSATPWQLGAVVPFYNWQVGHAYLLYLHKLASGQYEVLVYDNSAHAWTTVVAPFTIPPDWGTISTISLTGLWLGAGTYAACADFPDTDVSIYQPIGFSAGTVIGSYRVQDQWSGGQCPSQTFDEQGGWTRYRFTGTATG